MNNRKRIPPEIQEIFDKLPGSRNHEDINRVRNWIFQESQLRELLLYTWKNIGNRVRTAVAEDVLQEFCIKSLDAVIGGFEPDKYQGNFWGYLILCLRRFCYREGKNLQKEKNRFIPFTEKAQPEENYSDVLNHFPDNSIPLPDEKLFLEQCNSILKRFLNKLDSKYRDVFEKYYFEEKTLAEIAQELDISKVNAKVRLLRVRQQICKSLPGFSQYFQS